MFDLICHIEGNRYYASRDIQIINAGVSNKARIQIPEDALISFTLSLSNKQMEQGVPSLLIGDIPVELSLVLGHSSDSFVWNAVFVDPFTKNKTTASTPFKNNAGVSEFVLSFSSIKKPYVAVVDVLATKENEVLSREMLNYLSSRFSDVVNLCFSRTMIGAGNSDELTKCNITKLIKEAEKGISTVEISWPVFSRTIKTTSEKVMEIQRGGIPDSADGVIWLSQNQSNIVFCDSTEQTLKINNLPAKLIDGVVERIHQRANVKENFIILSYLFQIQQKLKLISQQLVNERNNKTDINSEYLDYVSLDHIISQYREPVIDELVRKVENLEKRAVNLYKKLALIMGESKPPKFYPPMMTPFVARNTHYRKIFTIIFDWYKLGDVVFTDTELFYGLRHLTTIYEFSCLIMILDSFLNMDYQVKHQEWRNYNAKSFGGNEAQRPINLPNNYFVITNDECEIEMYYEPKIWRKNHSKVGDPVVVLSENEDYEDHHLSPDFLLKVKWRNSNASDLLIFDAKYSPASSVKDFAIDKLINRYFFGIHQIGPDGNLGRLPTQAVWALYPKRGKTIVNSNFYASDHCLSGEMPLLPSLGGINLRPSKQLVFQQQLSLLMKKLSN